MARAHIFTLSERDTELVDIWIEEHRKQCNQLKPFPRGDFSSNISYTFTTLYNCITRVEVGCVCGAKEDVTDYGSF